MKASGEKLILMVILVCSLAGCKPRENILETAAEEATAIVQQARATAMVLGAQATATALIRQALGESPSSPNTGSNPAISPSLVSATPMIISIQLEVTPTAENRPEPSQTPLSETVELVSVMLAADGGFIMVNYKAPPTIANQWFQGNVSVTDEGSGMIYDQIPVMPIIGPLIAQPVEMGQAGYVMFINVSPGLPVGASVTVQLGDYIFEHVPVTG